MTKKRFLIAIGSLFLLSFVLRILIPPYALYGATHDDELMVVIASNLKNGVWLGSYESMGHLLLAKPPGFPIFLAATSWMPWAPTLTVHLILLFGLLIVMRELRALGFTRGLLLTLVGLLLFNPTLYNEQFSRIYREGMLTALTMLLLGLGLMLGRQLKELTSAAERNHRDIWQAIATSLSIGLGIGFYFISKPSWMYIGVLIAGYVTGALVAAKASWKRGVLHAGLSFAIIGVSALFVISGVLYLNNEKFGQNVIDTFSQGEFPRAMNVMYSVEDRTDRPYVDINSQMRRDMYRVSPTFAKLESYLEQPDGTGWRSAACNSPMKICDETGAWFPWELRDAVQQAGLGDSPAEFEDTFKAIRVEITGACESGRLKCEAQGITPGLDSLDSLSPRTVIDSFGAAAQHLLNPDLGMVERSYGGSDAKVPAAWQSVVKGLGPRVLKTEYEADDLALGDIRAAMAQLYRPIWPAFLGFGFVLALWPRSGMLRMRRQRQMYIIGLSTALAVVTLVGQISLFQASSGDYMIRGGVIYLLPLVPLVWLVAAIGIHAGISELRRILTAQTLKAGSSQNGESLLK